MVPDLGRSESEGNVPLARPAGTQTVHKCGNYSNGCSIWESEWDEVGAVGPDPSSPLNHGLLP